MNIFVASFDLLMCYLQSMDSTAFLSLADSYAIGDDVDYHTCFRACLNNVMKGSTSNDKSKFTMAPLSQARPVRESHPWQFQYITNGSEMLQGNTEIPYWKRACMQPRARPNTTQHAMSLDSGSYGFTRTAPGAVEIKEYEPKILSTANKVVNHPGYRQFRNELKRAQLTKYKGCCSTKNFMGILNLCQITLSKSELGAVMRVFRTRGMSDTITFSDFLDACNAAKDINM